MKILMKLVQYQYVRAKTELLLNYWKSNVTSVQTVPSTAHFQIQDLFKTSINHKVPLAGVHKSP